MKPMKIADLESKEGAGNLLGLLMAFDKNKRKDNFVKILKGNCYLKDVYYGIQILENSHGKPGKVIGRIQNQKEVNQWVKIIKDNIKNYSPPSLKSNRILSPDDKIEIMIRVATRDRLKSLKHKKETYDLAINRAIDSLVK